MNFGETPMMSPSGEKAGKQKIEKPTLSRWQAVVEKQGLLTKEEKQASSVKELPKYVLASMKELWRFYGKTSAIEYVKNPFGVQTGAVYLEREANATDDPRELLHLAREASRYVTDEFALESILKKAIEKAGSDSSLRIEIAREMLLRPYFCWDAGVEFRKIADSDPSNADAHEGVADAGMLSFAKDAKIMKAEAVGNMGPGLDQVAIRYEKAKTAILENAMNSGYRRNAGLTEDMKRKVEELEMKIEEATKLRHQVIRYESDPSNFSDYEAVGDKKMSYQVKEPAKVWDTHCLDLAIDFYTKSREKVLALDTKKPDIQKRIAQLERKLSEALDLKKNIEASVPFHENSGDRALLRAKEELHKEELKQIEKNPYSDFIRSLDINQALKDYRQARENTELLLLRNPKLQKRIDAIDKKIAEAEVVKKQLENKLQ